MKSLFKSLFFDKEVVVNIKKSNVDKEILYNHLFNGKITMQEYLVASKHLYCI